MKKKTRKAISSAAGAAMLLSGCAVSEAPVVQEQQQKPETSSSTLNYEITEGKKKETSYVAASARGSFSYNQDELTPGDEVFNLFGTVLTGACAKPAFELENGEATFYVNVGGNIKKAYSVNLKEMAEKHETEKTLLCACATGAATANVRIKGIPVENILELAESETENNIFTAVGSDGYGMSLPLSYVLEKEALIVYQVNGQELPAGTQLWIPETVAKYFTRDVVDIELSRSEEVPEVEARSEELRAEVVIQNTADDCEFIVGEEALFEGYADDCGERIAAVEFSLDGGESRTRYETADATAERWVYWNFGFVPEEAGEYRLQVRAVTESGRISPLAAELSFHVVEEADNSL